MILVFGSVNVDLVFPLEFLPTPGETVMGPYARIESGGKGANQAVAAAKDGAHVRFAGAVGRDMMAEPALAGLVAARVNLSRVARVEAATGCAAVCTNTQGHSQIAVGAGANLRARADQIGPLSLGRSTTLLLQMETDPRENAILIRRAREAGSRIILNLGPARALDRDALEAVDLLVLNDPEATWLGQHIGAGSNAASLHAALGIDVIRTRGVQGADYATGEGIGTIEAMQVEVTDTTGAGDCFIGVLAAGLDRGETVRRVLPRATVAAGLCCTKLGAQASLPNASEIDAAMPAYMRRAAVQPEV